MRPAQIRSSLRSSKAKVVSNKCAYQDSKTISWSHQVIMFVVVLYGLRSPRSSYFCPPQLATRVCALIRFRGARAILRKSTDPAQITTNHKLAQSQHSLDKRTFTFGG